MIDLAGESRAYRDDPLRPIAVLGIGNLLLSDDGVGIHTVRRLRSDSRVGSTVRLIDGGTVGTNLLAEVCGCEKLLIVNAVDAGLPPGSIIWIDFSSPDPQRIETRNAHQSGISGLLDDLRLLGQAPRQVALVGVQPAAIGLGTQLSPEVAGALPAVSAEVVRQVDRWRSASDVASVQEIQCGDPLEIVLLTGAMEAVRETSETSA